MNIEYVILIAVLSSLLAYYISAYYGEKTGHNIGKTQAIWDRYRKELKICHAKWDSGYKCNCSTKTEDKGNGICSYSHCNDYLWNELYYNVKRGQS